ncbi:hypothetical protein SAMN04489765_4671 [Tsukamurella pulmonis]|uniref:Uncharacterized protein n=1 Tax=Tsukamurella pulmonis TaxID=47312 RepID=A0A1H1HWF9_9ACTN|nr:hypothetical protein SAMN04489765_4671 [Tsukamurella pulmonis]
MPYICDCNSTEGDPANERRRLPALALTKPAIILLVIVAGIAGGAIGGSRPPRTSRAVRSPGDSPGAGSVNARTTPSPASTTARPDAQVLTVVAGVPRGAAALEGAGASPDVTMMRRVRRRATQADLPAHHLHGVRATAEPVKHLGSVGLRRNERWLGTAGVNHSCVGAAKSPADVPPNHQDCRTALEVRGGRLPPMAPPAMPATITRRMIAGLVSAQRRKPATFIGRVSLSAVAIAYIRH